MSYRERRLDRIKSNLYDMWIILTRMPLLVLFASSLIGGMAFIMWITGNIIRIIIK